MQNTQDFPWYHPSCVLMPRAEPRHNATALTPQEIYAYLDQRIYKQEEAKKAASLFVWKTLRGIKENAFFVGPSGCGKTQIFRELMQWEPLIDRISIVDASNITMDGWKGAKKVNTLFDDPVLSSGKQAILVLDEADKMVTSKVSSGNDDVAKHIQGELLKPLEGTYITYERNNSSFQVDTHKINVALLGAFSTKAEEIAEESKGASIGFGASQVTVQSYDKPLTQKDLLDFGVMPEFMGRVQRIVNLEPMTEADYVQMLSGHSSSLIQRMQNLYGISLHLTNDTCLKIAQDASESNLGIRGMQNIIQNMIDDFLFKDCTLTEIEF